MTLIKTKNVRIYGHIYVLKMKIFIIILSMALFLLLQISKVNLVSKLVCSSTGLPEKFISLTNYCVIKYTIIKGEKALCGFGLHWLLFVYYFALVFCVDTIIITELALGYLRIAIITLRKKTTLLIKNTMTKT